MTAEASGPEGAGERIAEILEIHRGEPTRLVEALQDIQAALRWLPREALEQASEALDVPLSRVCAVATFYAEMSSVHFSKTIFVFTVIISIWVIYRHRSNIQRLHAGQEKPLQSTNNGPDGQPPSQADKSAVPDPPDGD